VVHQVAVRHVAASGPEEQQTEQIRASDDPDGWVDAAPEILVDAPGAGEGGRP
jgi:hypothetical protein